MPILPIKPLTTIELAILLLDVTFSALEGIRDMKSAATLGLLSLFAVVLCSAADLESWRQPDYVRSRTIQNLARFPDSNFEGWYLASDEDGRVRLSKEESNIDAHNWWQIKMIAKKRNYTAHTIINRGNTRFNGHYLAIDPKTGELILSRRETNHSYWLVRYAGKYAGWDSFYIQSSSQTGGANDMAYLTIDEKSGELKLTNRGTRGMNWLIQHAPDLPAETKHY